MNKNIKKSYDKVIVKNKNGKYIKTLNFAILECECDKNPYTKNPKKHTNKDGTIKLHYFPVINEDGYMY